MAHSRDVADEPAPRPLNDPGVNRAPRSRESDFYTGLVGQGFEKAILESCVRDGTVRFSPLPVVPVATGRHRFGFFADGKPFLRAMTEFEVVRCACSTH